ARLSHDAWISCHSCHTDGHSSGLLVDTLGDGDYGAPKRVPSLLGTGRTGPWGWTGQVKSLDEQVRKSVTTTMHGAELSDRQSADLVAFLKTLRMPASPHVHDAKLVRRGRLVFQGRGCARCHTGESLTSNATFDVGLSDELGRRAFNPPSLRGLSHRAAFFHDGRVERLEHVVGRIRHMLDDPLSDAESRALLTYLRSL
ncbi:MAG: cytochrome c peroxidase, partial [Planctomycetaceae bacterium]